MAPHGLYSLAEGRRYASQVIDLIEEATERIDIAGDIRRRCQRVNSVVLVVKPRIMRTDVMFDLISPEQRDLLRECTDRLVRDGRIERNGEIDWPPRRVWGSVLRQGLYVAPKGERVPLSLHWADEASYGLRLALATCKPGELEIPRTFREKNRYLLWRLTGEVMPVPDIATMERCLGRKLSWLK